LRNVKDNLNIILTRSSPFLIKMNINIKAINKREAYELYSKLTAQAYALAAAQGTTPQKCQDPICNRWRRFEDIHTLSADKLLLLTEFDSPVFMLDEKGLENGCLNGGIIAVPAKRFQGAYRDDNLLTIEYTDGSIEWYEAERGLYDVYRIHSNNRSRFNVVFPMSEN
jgi:hypothetical protein